jgi:hypothetical protein
MPRYKVLKGVAHNIGHTFTSLMNYAGDDYSLGHILRFARQSGLNTLTIDFMTGDAGPPELLREPIAEMPRWYVKRFWDMLASSGSDRALVRSASLTLKFDLSLSRSRPVPAKALLLPVAADYLKHTGITRIEETPYRCNVSIVDIRGKEYSACFQDWWHVERCRYVAPVRRWWNPLTWLRRRGVLEQIEEP